MSLESYQYQAPALAKQGIRVDPADAATPVGTGVFRLDMTGAVDKNLAAAAAQLPPSEWIARTDSQVNGSVWSITRPGKYTFTAHITTTGAVRNSWGWVRGSAALPANPTLAAGGVRTLTIADKLGVAATALGETATCEVDIADGDIDGNNNTLQIMVTNGAGATGTGLVAAECGVTITRGPHIQSLA